MGMHLALLKVRWSILPVDAMSVTPRCRLSRDGQDVGGQARNIESSDDDGYSKLRGDIQAELLRSQESALAELTYAASVGNIEQVELLLARGLPINAGVCCPSFFCTTPSFLCTPLFGAALGRDMRNRRHLPMRKPAALYHLKWQWLGVAYAHKCSESEGRLA